MTDINLRLDLDLVQSSVQAAVRPAIESAIGKIDLPKIIESQLTAKPAKSQQEIAMAHFLYGAAQTTESLLDRMVRESIHNIAKEFVQRAVREQRSAIEDALTRMLSRSNDRMVKAFASAVEDAFASDWSFEMDVKVTHAVAEGADDDDGDSRDD